MVIITAKIYHPINVTKTLAIPPGKTFTASIHVLHIMVPMIILYSVLCAWPSLQQWDRIKLLLTGIPINFIILAVTIPPLLDGHIEMQLINLIQAVGGVRDKHLLLDWVIFIEMGGLWLLPILGALTCHMAVKEINFLSLIFAQPGTTVKTIESDMTTKKHRKANKISIAK